MRRSWTSAAGRGGSRRRSSRSCRAAGSWRSTRRPTWWRSRAGASAIAREVWCQDVLDLELDEPVDAIVSTATLHWVTDHDRLWARLARALRPGGVLEAQCGGEGNIDRVREVIERGRARRRAGARRLVALGVRRARRRRERRLREAGFTATRCWLEERPTQPRGRGRVRPHLDPAGAPRPPAARIAASRSPRRSWPRAAAARLRAAQRLRDSRRGLRPARRLPRRLPGCRRSRSRTARAAWSSSTRRPRRNRARRRPSRSRRSSSRASARG